MFKIAIGALALFCVEVVFVETSVKVLAVSHNIFTEAKVVYHTTKKVLNDEKTQEQLRQVKDLVETAAEVKDSVKPSK